MRRSREEAARTRRNAVEAASRLFRERGIDAVGVSDVMASLGMTGGGFYRHFESKEALAVEACAAAFAGSALARESSGSAEAMLRNYLSVAHRDAPGAGCPLPALASDIARQPAAVRQRYTEGVRSALARIQQLVPGATPEAASALLAGMVGALALAPYWRCPSVPALYQLIHDDGVGPTFAFAPTRRGDSSRAHGRLSPACQK